MRYRHDNIGQLKAAYGPESGVTARQNERFGYTYDAARNLAALTNGATRTFSLNELTSVSRGSAAVVAGTTTIVAANLSLTVNGMAVSGVALCQDVAWARTDLTLVDGTDLFSAIGQDSLGRSSTYAVTAYLPASASNTYDLNGNPLTHGTWHFAYDDENQLVSVGVTNSWRSDFAYDRNIRRRERVEYTWANSAGQINGIVLYVYDSKLLIEERSANNLPRVTCARGMDLSGSLEGASGRVDGSYPPNSTSLG